MASEITTTQADRWCQEALEEYDVASSELGQLRADPKVNDVASIIGKAKLSRAQKRLAAATVKADTASLVLQLKQTTDRGEVSFDLPEIALRIKLKW